MRPATPRPSGERAERAFLLAAKRTTAELERLLPQAMERARSAFDAFDRCTRLELPARARLAHWRDYTHAADLVDACHRATMALKRASALVTMGAVR